MRYSNITTFLFFLLLFSFQLSGQNKTSAKNLTKGDRPFYRTKQTDILFIGVENSFILYKDPSKKYSMKIHNGTLAAKDTLSKDSTVYAIHVVNTNPTTIYITKGNETYTYKFKNRKIPSPELKVYMGTSGGYSKGGNVKADDFSKVVSVVLELNNFDYDIAFKIINMEITKVSAGGNTNSLLADNQIEKYTKGCTPGDIYIFHNVVIEFENTKDQRSINGATFFIK